MVRYVAITCPSCGQAVEDKRSDKANARYWAGTVTAIQQHFELTLKQKYTKEAIHNFLKTERYGKKVEEIKGKIYERCARSSKMTVKQFAKYAEWAEAYAINDLGVPVEYWQQSDGNW